MKMDTTPHVGMPVFSPITPATSIAFVCIFLPVDSVGSAVESSSSVKAEQSNYCPNFIGDGKWRVTFGGGKESGRWCRNSNFMKMLSEDVCRKGCG